MALFSYADRRFAPRSSAIRRCEIGHLALLVASALGSLLAPCLAKK